MQGRGAPPWVRQCIGAGAVTAAEGTVRMHFDAATAERYTDAEIHDYGRDRRFAWRPPLRLTLRARASHPAAGPHSTVGDQGILLGTAGFGFWNAPFMLAQRVGRLPDAVWFFYASPPARMELVPGVPGWGWKAQVVHAHRWGTIAAGIPTLGAILAARLKGNARPAARWVQRLTGAHETLLPTDLTAWHSYQIDWLPDAATFFVDAQPVLRVPQPPRGPLGFVAWIDNQYAVVTPRGEFRSGILRTGAQWLEIADLSITSQ
jgi:hypothetical protein